MPTENLTPGFAGMYGVWLKRVGDGWHVVFNYDARASGTPGGPNEAKWFAPDEMPRTVHGSWEKEVVTRITREP